MVNKIIAYFYNKLLKQGLKKTAMERKGYYNDRLKAALLRHLPMDGIRSIGIEDAFIARRDQAGVTDHRFDRPLASLIVQGSKRTVIGLQEYIIRENQILTVAIDMPSSSLLLEATPDRPLLSIFFHINPLTIAELLLETGWKSGHYDSSINGVSVADADEDFIEGMARLVEMMDKPEPREVRSRIILRELHYLLLAGPQKSILQTLHSNGFPGQQLFGAIEFLRQHLYVPVRAGELAEAACMSESSLYRHFKTLTGYSPLQYHKQLRLHEARRLMLVENEQAAMAAFRVGFESVAQFNREYKRLFGQPPRRDTRSKK